MTWASLISRSRVPWSRPRMPLIKRRNWPYDLTEAVALFQLEETEYLELDGQIWYVVAGLDGVIGGIESDAGEFFLRMTEEGTGLATIPGLVEGDGRRGRTGRQRRPGYRPRRMGTIGYPRQLA